MVTRVLSLAGAGLFLCHSAAAQNAINLEAVATGLVAPIGVEHAGDARLFIVEQRGQVRIVEAGALLPTPFLDLGPRLVPARPGFDERGLLGLAFHPGYATNGRFFVFYSAPYPADRTHEYDALDVPVGTSPFTYQGVTYTGGQVNPPGDPALLASGAQSWRVFSGGTASITLPETVASVRFFFVHPPGMPAGSVQAFDAGGVARGAPVASRVATTPGSTANFVILDQATAGIRELRFTAGAAPAGDTYTLFVDNFQTFGFNCKNVLAEYRVSAGNPNLADAGSERILLEINKPQFNHNGGQLAFSPHDGYLYVAVGDGGAGGDTGLGHVVGGNAQSIDNLLGKILRLDVDGALPYAIPADNPFVGIDGRDEIYAYGLRNPWRFSFDRGPGHRLICSDVGQSRLEETNIIVRGGNYGWRIREGLDCFDPATPATPPPTCATTGADGQPLIPPIDQYPRTVGISVTSGYIYRGSAMPALNGQYIFGDWSRTFNPGDGSFFRLDQNGPGTWTRAELKVRRGAEANPRFGRYISAFGEDAVGELYVCSQDVLAFGGTTGVVHRISLAPNKGDTNCDGLVDFGDIDGFVVALVSEAGYLAQFPNCEYSQADVNGDTFVDFEDINDFVACLIAAGCP